MVASDVLPTQKVGPHHEEADSCILEEQLQGPQPLTGRTHKNPCVSISSQKHFHLSTYVHTTHMHTHSPTHTCYTQHSTWCSCIHPHIICTCLHTYMHTCMHMSIFRCPHMYTFTHMCTKICTGHTHIYTLATTVQVSGREKGGAEKIPKTDTR